MGTLKLWWATLADVARTAPREHLEVLAQDAGYALRLMRKNLGFTTVAVLTLALGIGANTAIFSVVNAVLLRPLPYPEPDRLVTFWRNVNRAYKLPNPEYFDYRERQRTLEEFAVYRTGGANLTGDGVAFRVNLAKVSAGFFPALGVNPFLGRAFAPEEDLPGNDRVVVLEHGFWLRRFGSDPSVVGQTVTLDGRDHVVVGVMPSGFVFPGIAGGRVDLWAPLALDRTNPGDRGLHNVLSVARIRAGVSFEQASQDIQRIASELKSEYPKYYPEQLAYLAVDRLERIQDTAVQDVRPALLVLLGAVGLVLLIACANVANLLLARAASREKEMALRAALGAGRLRLIRQLLTESTLLSCLGGLLGVVCGYWGLNALMQVAPQNLPRLGEVDMDFRVLLFAIALSVVTGILFGLAPALHVSSTGLVESLKEGGRGTGSAGRHRLRAVLVVSEIAVCLVLLIGASLLMRSFVNLLQVDPGFRSANILTLRLSVPESGYPEANQAAVFFQRLLHRVRALSGVQAAGAISVLPLAGAAGHLGVIAEGMPRNFPQYDFPDGLLDTHWRLVTPGYFATMGITLVRGRLFRESDDTQAPRVAVVDENFARAAWPEQEYIVGRRVALAWDDQVEPEWWTVVGVVRHTRHLQLQVHETVQAYFPHGQFPRPRRSLHLAVRTTGDPGALLPMLRREVAALDPALPLYDVELMDERLKKSVAQPRFNVMLMGLFALVALVLGAVGLYGVISYSVSQRTHEIGVRMALGAQRRDILRMVVGQGLWLTLIGVALGLAGAFALTRFLQSLLFGVSPGDPVTFAVVAVLLVMVALLACYVPAHRATKVDPMVALRYE